jgi:hypothetical protein
MDGTEQAKYSTAQIIFPEFYVHPEFCTYDKDQRLDAKDIAWRIGCNFDIKELDKERSHLTIYVTLTMDRKEDALTISELVTQSTFKVQHHLSFSMKYELLSNLINQSLGHAQGGWRMKHKNVLLFQLVPQPFDKQEEIGLSLKKKLYEEWI